MRFQELINILSEGGARDLETYRQWVGSTPISRNGRKYDGRVLKDDDLVRVWRSVNRGKHAEEALHLHPGMCVTMHTEYLDGYAGRDWREKTEWRTYEIQAHELVDVQTGEIDGDTLIFIPKEQT
jgi:hypothetical protein